MGNREGGIGRLVSRGSILWALFVFFFGFSPLPIPRSIFPNTASAHQFAHPKKETVTLGPDGISVEIRYDMSPGDEPSGLRKLFDSNQDGQVDDAEAEKMMDYLESSISGHTARLDGQKALLTRTERSADGVKGQADRPSEINFVLKLHSEKISAGLHVFEISERSRLTSVPIAARLQSALLVTSNRGPADFAAKMVGPTEIGGKDSLLIVFLVN